MIYICCIMCKLTEHTYVTIYICNIHILHSELFRWSCCPQLWETHSCPITDLQQISGPDGIGRITCIDSSGTAGFAANGRWLETGGVSQTRNGTTATLMVNTSNVGSFQNRGVYCTNFSNFFYLYISSASKFPH